VNLVIGLIALSAVSDLLSGMRDGSNFVSTIISTRALGPSVALRIAAAVLFAGPFVLGVAVARTFGQDIVDPSAMSVEILVAATVGAVIWNLLTWFFSVPSSSTHAILGGLLGAVGIGAGFQAIYIHGLSKVLLSLILSPALGFGFGYVLTRLVYYLSRRATPRINADFRRGQIATAAALALSYGANDAEKSMGLNTMGLVSAGILPAFHVPLWIIALSAFSTSLGVLIGGERLVRTLGGRLYRIQPIHGFSSQLSSAIVILGAALVGGPVSSSQVITTSILGVGSSDRLNQIRWGLATHIVEVWLITIPACALLAAGAYWMLGIALG
jgi:PiT family inorganic phosphate transporter